MIKYLAQRELDLLSQLLVAEHLCHGFLEGVRLTKEVLHLLVCLLGYQCGIFIILADILLGPDTLGPEHPAHLLLLGREDLWQDDGLQDAAKLGDWLGRT